MRKTLSSMLGRASVAEGQRQAIAGHKRGTILNRHYTAHHSRDLKEAIDTADFKLVVEEDEARGHPVIRSRGLATRSGYAVEVILDEASEAGCIRVLEEGAAVPVFEFNRIDPASGSRLCATGVCKAARAFREFVEGHSLKLPRHPLKRFAIEHFQALA